MNTSGKISQKALPIPRGGYFERATAARSHFSLIGLLLSLVAYLSLSGCTTSPIDNVIRAHTSGFYSTRIQYMHFDSTTGSRLKTGYPNPRLIMQVADNGQWMIFVADVGSNIIKFGEILELSKYPKGLEVVTDFIAWSKLPPQRRIEVSEKLNSSGEFTSVKARVAVEQGSDEPLLIFDGAALPLLRVPKYAVDVKNAEWMLKMVAIWKNKNTQ